LLIIITLGLRAEDSVPIRIVTSPDKVCKEKFDNWKSLPSAFTFIYSSSLQKVTTGPLLSATGEVYNMAMLGGSWLFTTRAAQ
jgi:hypothetical protein